MAELSALALSALGIFREGPTHAYEVYRVMLERRHDRVVKLRPGTLYHAIGRLADTGLLEVVGTEREGNRPERTTYALTPAGSAVLAEQVAELAATPVYEYPRFPVALAELHSLTQDRAVAVLSRRLAVLRAELAVQAEGIHQLGERRMPPVFFLELGYQHAVLTAEADWISAVLRDLESGALDWSARTPPLPARESDALRSATPLYPDLPPRKAL